MSDTASFSDHIHTQVNKANKVLGFIRCTINGGKILSPTLRSLYVIHIIICSNLEYASEIWSPKSVTMIKRIEGVQRCATRLPDFSYNECLKRLNLLPLVYHRKVKDLSTFYKLKCGHFKSSLNWYFVQMRDNGHTLVIN